MAVHRRFDQRLRGAADPEPAAVRLGDRPHLIGTDAVRAAGRDLRVEQMIGAG
jgi:hypothetical protein